MQGIQPNWETQPAYFPSQSDVLVRGAISGLDGAICSSLISCKEANSTLSNKIAGAILFIPKQISRVLSWIKTIVQRYIFCSCSYSQKNDKQTKEVMDEIHNLIIKENKGYSQKKFGALWEKLPLKAKKEFKWHIALLLAADQGCLQYENQKKWLNEEIEGEKRFNKLRFNEYLDAEKAHPIVAQAVVNFKGVIDRNCK